MALVNAIGRRSLSVGFFFFATITVGIVPMSLDSFLLAS